MRWRLHLGQIKIDRQKVRVHAGSNFPYNPTPEVSEEAEGQMAIFI